MQFILTCFLITTQILNLSVNAFIMEPVQGHSAVMVQDVLYVYGGVTQNRVQSDTFALDCSASAVAILDPQSPRASVAGFEMDVDSPDWRLLPATLNRATTLHAAVRHANGTVFYYGGAVNGQMSPLESASLMRFDLSTGLQLVIGPGQWPSAVSVPISISGANITMPIVINRVLHAAAILDNTLYVYGGVGGDGTVFNDLIAVNLDNLTATRLQTVGDSPGLRQGHSMVSINGDDPILILFGGIDQRNLTSNEIYSFHPKTMRWIREVTIGNASPGPRARHTSNIIPGTMSMITFGGFPSLFTQNNYYNDIFVLDATVSPFIWRKIPSAGDRIPEGFFGHAADANQDALVVYGGYDQRNQFSSQLFVLDMGSDPWQWRATYVDSAARKALLRQSQRQQEVLTLVVLLSLIPVMMIVYFILRRRYPDSHNGAIFVVPLSILNFVSDIINIATLSGNNYPMLLLQLYLASIIVPSTVNLILAFWAHAALIQRQPSFRMWFQRNSVITSIFTLLAATNIEVITILSSRLFQLSALSAPVEERQRHQWMIAGLVAIILSDVPQLVITFLLAQTGDVPYTTVFSITMSALSLLYGLIYRLFLVILNKRPIQEKMELESGTLTKENISWTRRLFRKS